MIKLNRQQQIEIVRLLDSLVNSVQDAMEHINEGDCYCNVCVDVHKAEQIIEDIKFNGNELEDEGIDTE